MKRASTLTLFLLLFLFASVGLAAAQSGGSYEITSSTLDSGGGEVSGGQFELNGTVGQSDISVVSGGDYSVSQGFWQNDGNSVPTSVQFNTAATHDQSATLFSIALMVVGAMLLTMQLRKLRREGS